VVRCDEGCYRGGRVVPYKIIARGRGNDYKYCPYNVSTSYPITESVAW
jgi:hypothetical protein